RKSCAAPDPTATLRRAPDRARSAARRASPPRTHGHRRRCRHDWSAARRGSELAEGVDDLARDLSVRVAPPAIEHAEQRQLRLEGDAGVHTFASPLFQELRLAAAERILIAVLADQRIDGLHAALLAVDGTERDRRDRRERLGVET